MPGEPYRLMGSVAATGRIRFLAMSDRPTALLCTSNGVGLGHLSRAMAIGSQMRESLEPVIFTLSAAVSIPVAEGFRTEYLRSYDYSALGQRDWNLLLEQRIEHLIDIYHPSVLVYDGTHPYAGMCRALDRHPEIHRAWLRRGMWKVGRGEVAMTRVRHFDEVLEPGDYAVAYDQGLTASVSEGVTRFSPIRYGSSPMARDEARAVLGLDPDRPLALIQLGAGAINDVGSLVRSVVGQLIDAGIGVVVAASVLSRAPEIDVPGVAVVQRYPISDCFGAFDLGFFAGGYNSFHEALSLGLPSVFAPNLATRMDDQSARTRYAHDHGLSLDWADNEQDSLAALTDRIIDADFRAELRAAMGGLPPASGGAEVAAHLIERHAG